MKKNQIVIVLTLFLLPVNSAAQSSNVTFVSSELQDMALRYAGSSLNWPILVTLADHDVPTNTFTLTPADLLQLESLAAIATKISSQRSRLDALIKRGATLFAKEELEKVNGLFDAYSNAIQEGNLDQALEAGNAIPATLDELEEAVDGNRLVKVQAHLSEKKGDVEKRLGLLAMWENAFEGDMFEESDGIRTLEQSYANLLFTDGSSVLIDPGSEAVIRRSRVDKLDESADAEINLIEGGLLAKLSQAGKQKSRYVLNAGDSKSELRTQNFFAESDGGRVIKLTNYDGNVDVSANDVTISIKKNEGTIVREGQPPTPPIKLLPAPRLIWNSQDTVIYKKDIVFPFREVSGAKKYLVQLSSNSSFNQNIREIETTTNTVALDRLSNGRTFIKVVAVDRQGLRGPSSDVIQIIRNQDNKPPPVFVYGLDRDINFTVSNNTQIIGFTEPDAQLTIDSQKVAVQSSGRFTHSLKDLKDDQTVIISATDGSGNETRKPVRIVKLSEEKLFEISYSGATQRNVLIQRNQPSVTLSGTAFPGLEVLISNNETDHIVHTDTSGRWGITTTVQEGKLSVTFRDIKTGSTYFSKSFTVEAN